MSLGLYDKLLRRKICKSGWQESWQEASKSSWQQDKKPPPPSCQGDAKKQDWQCLDLSVGMAWCKKDRRQSLLLLGLKITSKIHFLELRGGLVEDWERILERMTRLLSWHLALGTWEPSGDTKKAREATEKEVVCNCQRRSAFSVNGKV